MLRRARLGIGMLAVGLTLALLPAATASATVEKSALCKAYQSEVAKQTKASATVAKEMASGKWSTVKKALLATFNSEANSEKQFSSYLNGASGKVKAAAAVAVQLNNTVMKVLQKSTSRQQFETGILAAESTPKVSAALKVLGNYSATICK